MKITADAAVRRCEGGSVEVSVAVAVDSDGRGYGRPDPIVGALDHALDGARKTVVQALAGLPK